MYYDEDRRGLPALVSSGSKSPTLVLRLVALGYFISNFLLQECHSILSPLATSVANRRCVGEAGPGAGRASSLPPRTGPADLFPSLAGCLLSGEYLQV